MKSLTLTLCALVLAALVSTTVAQNTTNTLPTGTSSSTAASDSTITAASPAMTASLRLFLGSLVSIFSFTLLH
ncbi:hypothetical protein AOXY_G25782 [Acipenser oxyrinchus oxyrinchus]|uniref:CAMPATH-1 antigen n=1 Tax=Acipenser oxyrinchus oxyrinchus TaxID=40147 RepID=A0AAD8FUV9_ACIOX|nr:hypothetical protein AOXY_G25782 [Acipenser oxyrinchus oxyrinchus]